MLLMKIYYVQYMVYLTSQKEKYMIVVVISFQSRPISAVKNMKANNSFTEAK